jgi:hypothetical protein
VKVTIWWLDAAAGAYFHIITALAALSARTGLPPKNIDVGDGSVRQQSGTQANRPADSFFFQDLGIIGLLGSNDLARPAGLAPAETSRTSGKTTGRTTAAPRSASDGCALVGLWRLIREPAPRS